MGAVTDAFTAPVAFMAQRGEMRTSSQSANQIPRAIEVLRLALLRTVFLSGRVETQAILARRCTLRRVSTIAGTMDPTMQSQAI